MNNIPEKDWKLLRSIKDEKLNLACKNIINKINEEIENGGVNYHKSYLNIWEIVNNDDKEIASNFNDLRRSNAIMKLALWKRSGLLTEQELNRFSEDTRKIIKNIINC